MIKLGEEPCDQDEFNDEIRMPGPDDVPLFEEWES